MGDHPWRRLRDRPDWLLLWDDLPLEVWGLTDRRRRVVTLSKRLTQAERRCTIAHELEHFDIPTPRNPVLVARLERQINQRVARRLIPVERLGDALAWAHSLAEAAEELWVDEDTLRTRLEHLHPAERAYITGRMEHRHEH